MYCLLYVSVKPKVLAVQNSQSFIVWLVKSSPGWSHSSVLPKDQAMQLYFPDFGARIVKSFSFWIRGISRFMLLLKIGSSSFSAIVEVTFVEIVSD